MTGGFKNKISEGKAVYGTMVSIFDNPDISRILKNAGFEWFFFDCEHGYPNIDRLYAIFGYAKMAGITALIRIPQINKTEVFRALDMGASGIVCPNVENFDEARELIRLAKYAPMGERGVSMTRPHTEYRKIEAIQYMEQANKDTMIFCQIESLKGVNNLDSILRVDGVDGVLIGPNDLTQSMGIINQLNNPDYLKTVEQIIASCKKHDKIAGISGKDLKVLRYWESRGAQLLQWGTDVSLLMEKIRNGLEEFRQ
jgi:2-dehydro-3-deoxyglucarate aldolase/4-hydroxy-2-oxoheptanedioate aldolase